jgi:hypothetical protein
MERESDVNIPSIPTYPLNRLLSPLDYETRNSRLRLVLSMVQ